MSVNNLLEAFQKRLHIIDDAIVQENKKRLKKDQIHFTTDQKILVATYLKLICDKLDELCSGSAIKTWKKVILDSFTMACVYLVPEGRVAAYGQDILDELNYIKENN